MGCGKAAGRLRANLAPLRNGPWEPLVMLALVAGLLFGIELPRPDRPRPDSAILCPGPGRPVRDGDVARLRIVLVDYLKNGCRTHEKGCPEPADFVELTMGAGHLAPGFEEAVRGMRVGELRRYVEEGPGPYQGLYLIKLLSAAPPGPHDRVSAARSPGVVYNVGGVLLGQSRAAVERVHGPGEPLPHSDQVAYGGLYVDYARDRAESVLGETLGLAGRKIARMTTERATMQKLLGGKPALWVRREDPCYEEGERGDFGEYYPESRLMVNYYRAGDGCVRNFNLGRPVRSWIAYP